MSRQWDDLDRLLERCRRSDERAWGVLVDRFQGLVYSIPKRYGLNDDDAADVFQTTFQALLRSMDRIEQAQTIPKWLAVTAARESLKVKRLAGRSLFAEDSGLVLDEIVATEEADAEQTAILSERSLIVREGIAGLGQRCKDLLSALYLEEDASYEAVSKNLGLPVGAIGPTRARCLDKLRKALSSTGFFENLVSDKPAAGSLSQR